MRGIVGGALELKDSFGQGSGRVLFDDATPRPTPSTVAYVRPGQPRCGMAQLFSETMIGERSYKRGESTTCVLARVGEGGK